jgi:hypothetical protein
MAKDSGSSTGYKPLGGKSRRYVNTRTGETISRYQYDKLYGSTKDFKGSTHLKAKVNRELNPAISKARPAKGRKSTLKKVGNTQARNLKTTKEKKFRDVLIPIHHKNKIADLERLYLDFDFFILGLKENSRVFGVATTLIYLDSGGDLDGRNLIPAKRWPTVSDLKDALEVTREKYKFLGEVKLKALSMHVIFSDKYMKTL